MAISSGYAVFSRLAIAATITALTQAPARAADPTGNWFVADHTAQIKIESCGTAGLYGVIDWEKVPGVDENNHDPSRRGKPMLGVAILVGLKPNGQGQWQGQVYNPKDGGFYFARLSMPQSNNALRLEGCILGGLLCDGETWTRVTPATTGAAPGRIRNACPAAAAPPAQKPVSQRPS
jgi:uncharacterized protein (DUF2147 family)